MKKRDYYYWEAKRAGFKSRAAFKLIQINNRFYIIRKGYSVLDLGAAPGGWSQVALELVGDEGKVVAVDKKRMRVDGVLFIKGDVYSDETLERIKEVIEYADVVLSDMAPNISGISSLDHAKSVDIAERALYIAENVLRPRGHFVVKVFQGDMLPSFIKKCKADFDLVKVHKPKASNRKSPEVYVVCKRFKFSSTP